MTTNPRDVIVEALTKWPTAKGILDALTEHGFVVVACPPGGRVVVSRESKPCEHCEGCGSYWIEDDDGCEAARAMGAAIVGCEEMQAIKAVLLALSAINGFGAPRVDVLRLAGLPEIVVDWVMSA